MRVQPVLFVVCEVEGLVYINGRLAGTTGPERPLAAPVSPGSAYLEYKPLYPGFRAMARQVTAGEGQLEAGEGLYALRWPSGVVEVEIVPERERETARREGSALPDYALEPDDERRGRLALFVGPCRDGGRYAAAIDEGGRCVLAARGDESYFTQNGEMRLFRRENDTVGHARLLTYRETEAGMELADCENMWAPGGPTWPDTPERTALAAAEAAILGLWDEADGYLLPERREACRDGLRACAAFDCASPMRVPLPDGRSAVALCRAAGERVGEAKALYYHAVPGGGIQGPWRLDRMELE